MVDNHRVAERYRRLAETCLKVASRMSLRKDRERLIQEAHQWLALAEEAGGQKDGSS